MIFDFTLDPYAFEVFRDREDGRLERRDLERAARTDALHFTGASRRRSRRADGNAEEKPSSTTGGLRFTEKRLSNAGSRRTAKDHGCSFIALGAWMWASISFLKVIPSTDWVVKAGTARLL